MADTVVLTNSTDTEVDYLHDPIQYVIDNELRVMDLTDNGTVLGVQGDKNVNRVNFKMPAWYNGINMSEFIPRVTFRVPSPEPKLDYYDVTDLTVYDKDDKLVTSTPSQTDTIYFSWLVDSNATTYIGTVDFAIRMIKVNDSTKSWYDSSKPNNYVLQAFNTRAASAQIVEGLSLSGEISPEDQEDILMHMKGDIKDYTDNQILEIQAAATEAKESIPENYNELSDSVADLKDRIKAIESYLTPEMFGAIGDGVADDTEAILNLAQYATGKNVFGNGKYYVDPTVEIPEFNNVNFIYLNLKVKPYANVSNVSVGVRFINCTGSLDLESTMTEIPATGWGSTAFKCSNVDISFENGKYDLIRCKSLDECSVVRSTKFFADTIICEDTLFGLLTENADGVVVNNLYTNLHDNDTELMHSLYIASGTKNVWIGTLISKNCPYYPIHIWSQASDLSKRASNVVIDNAILYGTIQRAIANTGYSLTINRIVVESEVVDTFVYGDYKATIINSGNVICNNLTGGYTSNVFGEHKTFVNNCDVKCRALTWAGYYEKTSVVFDNCYIHDWDLIGSNSVDALIKNCIIKNIGRMSGSQREKGIIVTFKNTIFDGMSAGDFLWANIEKFVLNGCEFKNCTKTGYYFAARNSGKIDVYFTDASNIVSGAHLVKDDNIGANQYNIGTVI